MILTNLISFRLRKVLMTLLIFFLIGGTGLILSPEPAQALVFPFGGPITYISYYPRCYVGTPMKVGPPGPVQSYMFARGITRSFIYGFPTHISQLVLGIAVGYLPCVYQCGPYVCVGPGGPIVLFHGSSK